eukprot:SAG11_NODE_1676_length_4475_cov_6.069698_4_plen_135_part_00
MCDNCVELTARRAAAAQDDPEQVERFIPIRASDLVRRLGPPAAVPPEPATHTPPPTAGHSAGAWRRAAAAAAGRDAAAAAAGAGYEARCDEGVHRRWDEVAGLARRLIYLQMYASATQVRPPESPPPRYPRWRS